MPRTSFILDDEELGKAFDKAQIKFSVYDESDKHYWLQREGDTKVAQVLKVSTGETRLRINTAWQTAKEPEVRVARACHARTRVRIDLVRAHVAHSVCCVSGAHVSGA